jgi:hypothetical protein
MPDGFEPRPGAIFYRTTKAALNREMQIVAASEHQEYLKSYAGMLQTSFTVENMINTIGKATIEDTGRFLRYDGAVEPW